MGSFYKICGITGITITDNEPCYVTRLERRQHVYRHGPNVMEVDQEFQPISFPQLTTYYDYGRVDEKFKPNPINSVLGLNVHCDGEDVILDEYYGKYRISDSLFLVHQKVYEKLSSELLDTDGMYHYKADIMEQGPQYFIGAFNAAKEMAGDKIHMLSLYLESFHIFGWRHSKIGNKIMNLIYKHKDYTVFDDFVKAGLAEELYKQFIFEQNMSVLWKHYTPSNYGSQFDNYEAYDKLADIIKEVSVEKKQKWDEEYGEEEGSE